MAEIHDFGTPRNLYEKLIRDGEMLERKVNGDNVFNFISTAFHLQHWIKNSPLIASEVMKRILRRISRDKNIMHCQNIARAKEHFSVELDDAGSAFIKLGEDRIEVLEFKNEIIALYENYFKQKGH